MTCNLALSITKATISGGLLTRLTPDLVRGLLETYCTAEFAEPVNVYLGPGQTHVSGRPISDLVYAWVPGGNNIQVVGGRVNVRHSDPATGERIAREVKALLEAAAGNVLDAELVRALGSLGARTTIEQATVDNEGKVEPATLIRLAW